VHAERNDAYRIDPTRPAESVHFIQMWVRPDEPGGPSSYQQRELALDDLAHHWVPIASGRHPDAVVNLGSASSTLWVSVLPTGISRRLPYGDLLHVYLAGGIVDVETIGRLVAGDSLRLFGSAQLEVSAGAEAELLVWQMDRERGELR
jgi:quercetin 2,3-dioxygenase